MPEAGPTVESAEAMQIEHFATSRTLPELTDLRSRTAIVTGGSRGIGRGIAERLHEAGASIVVAGRDLASAQRLVDMLDDRRTDSALAAQVDVTDEGLVAAMVSAAVERFGGVDVMVNNAGAFPIGRIVDIDLPTFRTSIDVNLIGTFLCTRAAARVMIEQERGGSIINVTSIAGMHRAQLGLAHYDASKHGAWGFTRTAAWELAPHHIRVNAIAPGPIKTDASGYGEVEVSDEMRENAKGMAARVPMGRFGEPDEVGRVALFLASDLSSYMTGAHIAVDGGVLLS
ncbi:SDR family NAD(P)-dependent oxidoreductase [Nocardioides immobilis]|nr:SDR family NAD(P)-dependent oxidoreductase [Nocardioides immobilis]